MLRLFFTPGWFNGWDLVFDAVGLVIAVLIAVYSWRIYRLNKENRFGYLALAFVLVALGLLFKLSTNGILYYTPIRDAAAEVLQPVTGPHLVFANLFYRAGFFLEMASLLGAWLLIFLVSQKPRERLKKFYEISQIGLFVYLILLISIVSNFKYFVFYLTSAVFLALITLNYYKNYLNNQNNNTFRIMLAFLFLLCANIFLVFVFLWEGFYFFGEVFLLIGFLLLLYTYRKIVRR